jgi:site-specific DNA recombinase
VFNPEDTEDRFLSLLFGALSAREKEKFVERTRRGKMEAARKGAYLAPIAPFGYRLEGGRLAVHALEARVVKLIFSLVREGKPIRAIARTLNLQGVPTPRRMREDRRASTKWAKSTIHRIIGNSLYVGKGSWNRRHRIGSKHEWRPEEQWIAVPGIPRIVTDEVFLYTQKLLRRNATMAERNQRRIYLLKGLLRCAACGRTMYGVPFHDVRFYRCAAKPTCKSRSIKADNLERFVWAEITKVLQQPDLIIAEARRQHEGRFGDRDALALKLDSVREALRKLPDERKRVLDTYQEGYMPWAETKTRLDDLKHRQDITEEECARMEAQLSTVAASQSEAEMLESILERFGRRLASLAPEEQMQVLRGFVRSAIVHADGGVELETFVPAPAPKDPQGKVHAVRTLWPPAAAISSARRAYA